MGNHPIATVILTASPAGWNKRSGGVRACPEMPWGTSGAYAEAQGDRDTKIHGHGATDPPMGKDGPNFFLDPVQRQLSFPGLRLS